MKKVLNTALCLNLLIDGPVGLFLIFSPQTFLPSGGDENLFWVRNYGVAAFSIACMIFWVWSSRDDFKAVGVALGLLMAFHCVLTVVLFLSGVQPVGAILHLILATLFAFLYFQRSKWCEEQR